MTKFKTFFCIAMAMATVTSYGQDKDPSTYDEGVVINGVKWATRNVDSHGRFVYNVEGYGGLFQWGRVGDGHEWRSSAAHRDGVVVGVGGKLDANGQVSTSHAAFGKFITGNDWRNPESSTLWNSGTVLSPVKTVNDPCPAGWRVPTQAELKKLLDAGSTWTKMDGVGGRLFGKGNNMIFLPAAGYRPNSGGNVSGVGANGNYWSTSEGLTRGVSYLRFSSAEALLQEGFKTLGVSVRCVAE